MRRHARQYVRRRRCMRSSRHWNAFPVTHKPGTSRSIASAAATFSAHRGCIAGPRSKRKISRTAQTLGIAKPSSASSPDPRVRRARSLRGSQARVARAAEHRARHECAPRRVLGKYARREDRSQDLARFDVRCEETESWAHTTHGHPNPHDDCDRRIWNVCHAIREVCGTIERAMRATS